MWSTLLKVIKKIIDALSKSQNIQQAVELNFQEFQKVKLLNSKYLVL